MVEMNLIQKSIMPTYMHQLLPIIQTIIHLVFNSVFFMNIQIQNPKGGYDDLTDSSNNYTIGEDFSEQGIFLEGIQIEAGFMYSLSSFLDIEIEAGYMMPVEYKRTSLTVNSGSFEEEETTFEKCN